MTDTAPNSMTPVADPVASVAAPVAPATPPVASSADPAPTVMPEWMGGLPDELKSDPTLSRYKSVDDLARGHVEAHKVAKSKVVLPGDTPESWSGFADAVRPASADIYNITVPEGFDSAFADAARPVFHDLALLPQQVDGLVKFQNDYAQAQIEAATQKSVDDVEAFKTSYNQSGRNYDRSLAAVSGMMTEMGIDGEQIDKLQSQIGAADTLKFLFGIADKVGEQQRVTGDATPNSGGVSPSEADAVLKAKRQDPEWRAKVKIEGTPQHAEYKRLVALKSQAAMPPST